MKNHYRESCFSAFTMAEVLITIGIIGVIAAMTIPTIISNSHKEQTVVMLKKTFNTVSQAHKMAEVELGSSTGWGTPVDGSAAATKDWWNTYFIPYANLSVLKSCDASNYLECWAGSTDKYLDGTALPIPSDRYYFLLADGSALCLSVVTNTTGGMYVDINGLKTPNMVGKDIFLVNLLYTNGNVEFPGTGLARATILASGATRCNKDAGTAKGSYCGALIQQDGWQIADDYPWN